MSSFLITTTGTQDPVVFNDLGGRAFTHPTVSYNLATEYSIEEINNSASVQAAITAGYITVLDAKGDPITKIGTDKYIYSGNFHNSTGPVDFIQEGGTTYVTVNSFVFLGTSVHTPTRMYVILSMTNGASRTGYARLYDATNAVQIGEVTKTQDVKEIKSFSLSNLPTGQALFEVQIKLSQATGQTKIHSWYIK